MSESRDVSLAVATPADAPLLANLLELYLHDLSEAFPIEVGADGRFGYEFLPLYWTEAGRRFPFLIRHGPHIAGFALVTRGSPASEDPRVLDVADGATEVHRPIGSEAVVAGAGAGPSPLASRSTRTDATLKSGCFETGSQSLIVSSFAARVCSSRAPSSQ